MLLGLLDPVGSLEIDNAAAILLLQVETRATQRANNPDNDSDWEQSGHGRRANSFDLNDLTENWGNNSEEFGGQSVGLRVFEIDS